VDPVPDPLLLRKSGSAGNQTWHLWICSQESTLTHLEISHATNASSVLRMANYFYIGIAL
jgi:hypothetical protein